MDQFARSAADIDEMANTLRRLDTGGSYVGHPMQSQHPSMPSPPLYPDGEDMYRVPSHETADSTAALCRPTSKGRPSTRKDSRASERRPSRTPTTGSASGYTLYPAPSKPPGRALPPVPPLPKGSRPPGSRASVDNSDAASSRYSECSRTNSHVDYPSASAAMPMSPGFPLTPMSLQHSSPDDYATRPAPLSPQPSAATPLDLAAWKILATKNEKGIKDPAIYYFDVSTTATTLASKHGNKLIKVWNVGTGAVQSTIKFSCYTTAQARSREYFVRSHAILSESTTLIAIATGFGDTLEIWDWAKKKKLQSIDKADRWAAVRSNVYESAWSPLVTYHGHTDTIDLYHPTHDKKPFKRSRTIELRRAGLPVLPKYPELAFSATSPILVTASGPRPPRLGHPPPERETLLVAWEIADGPSGDIRDSTSTIVTSEPYRVVAPWQHAELDTALPSGLAAYGSIAVSIWIPASYRALPVPASRGGQGYNLQPVKVHWRYVLVWDFSVNSTRTFRIPNTISCVSPDCRYVGYCDTRGTDVGARGSMVILDATTGKQLWCWPDPEAGAMDSGPKAGFEQLERLGKVTEMSFAADSGFLFVGDIDGNIGVYEIRELSGDRVQVVPQA
ncbi:hypothetical protein QBC47DRAFT_338205 [Echria macrotheca]|uniref:Uncharacterized protein n=1 Tax=Echria macrotheca TaxID=438768 RepID=A0AAJ0BM79_9PEZI|nr:hypothetical protein QBC47DRAFT_338205 [Echria macrotheca]